MNILILSNIEAGGEWIATQTLIEKLRKKDERLKFYLITSSKNKYLLKESLFEKIIYIKHKYYKKPFKYYRELFYQINSGKNIIDELFKKQKFDRIIVTDYLLAISYIISQRRFDYTYFFHGIRNNYRIFSDTFNHYLIVKKLLEIFAWFMSKKIIIPTIKAKSLFMNNKLLFKKKSFLILPNLVRKEFYIGPSLLEVGRFKKKFGILNKKIIIYSGRLSPNKGVENLIRAFLQITKKFPKTILTVAYPGIPDADFFKGVKVFPKQQQIVFFLDNLSTKELSLLYQSSDLAVLPSPFEVSSIFLREALACELPIISTHTGDSAEFLSDMFILRDNRPKTIYEKINDYLKNEKKYRQNAKIVSDSWKKLYNEGKIIFDKINILKNL